ncbi:hypothetical protein ACH5RR_007122 [Cinchona calisaya]|uniref:Pectinesterase n=1 Tax=Cinchona calisaya TaxID=153742 RepID=A0ABD3ARB0_9GENT
MAKAILVALFITLVIGMSLYIGIHFQHKHENKPNSTHTTLAYNATVSTTAKLGSYTKIMDAIASAPTYGESKYYIHVEAGVYVENVYVWKNKTNIALIGDGAEVTMVTMNRKVPVFDTIETATQLDTRTVD